MFRGEENFDRNWKLNHNVPSSSRIPNNLIRISILEYTTSQPDITANPPNQTP